MPLAAVPYILFLGFIFGSTLIASRFSVGQFHPTSYVALRMLLASLGYVAIYAISRNRNWPRDRSIWVPALLLGSIGTAVPMVSIVTSLQYLSSGLVAILITMGPAITVVMAHFFLPDESLSWRKAAGVSLAFGGALLLALRGETGLAETASGGFLGYGLVFLALLCGNSATIYIRKYQRETNSFDLSSARMVIAAVIVIPLAYIFVGFDLSDVTTAGYGALFYASFAGTFSGVLMLTYLAQRFGATATAMTDYVLPVFAAIGGSLLLDEKITAVMIWGMVMIAGGIALLNRRGRRRVIVQG